MRKRIKIHLFRLIVVIVVSEEPCRRLGRRLSRRRLSLSQRCLLSLFDCFKLFKFSARFLFRNCNNKIERKKRVNEKDKVEEKQEQEEMEEKDSEKEDEK